MDLALLTVPRISPEQKKVHAIFVRSTTHPRESVADHTRGSRNDWEWKLLINELSELKTFSLVQDSMRNMPDDYCLRHQDELQERGVKNDKMTFSSSKGRGVCIADLPLLRYMKYPNSLLEGMAKISAKLVNKG